MIQNLYLILFAIAALGIIGLVLVFFGYDRRAGKKIQLAESPTLELDNEWETEAPIEQESDLAAEDAHVTNALGFSVADVLLTEPKTYAEPTYAALMQSDRDNPDLIILNVMALPQCEFVGYELLQALLATGLRYGDMNIFHRYADNTENSPVLFSVASAVEPGVFDLANMGAYSCPGLSLFMSISQSEIPFVTFEFMLETARQLADDLAGELCDENHNVLSISNIEDYQARVRP